MALGKKLLLSLSVFAIMQRKRLPDGSRVHRQFPGWFESLVILTALLLQRWGRCPAERGEQTLRYAQLSAQLSARPCSLGWSCFHTTLRCTESIHFLWSLSRMFSGLLERPWISSAVADGTVFAWLLNLCLNVCSPSQVLGDVYTEVLEAAYSLHRGPLIIRGV